MRTTASEGAQPYWVVPHAAVIGAACVLSLAAIAIAVPDETVTLAGAHSLAPLQAALPADALAQEYSQGVPVSLLIQNDSDEDDRLLGGNTPGAHCAGLRRTLLVNGRRETAAVPEGIVIPGNATTTLEPGSSHLALFGLRTNLVQGDTFPLTLRFERAGEVTVIARVRRRIDAAGIEPLPEVTLGDLSIAQASAPPAPGPSLTTLQQTLHRAVGHASLVVLGASQPASGAVRFRFVIGGYGAESVASGGASRTLRRALF